MSRQEVFRAYAGGEPPGSARGESADAAAAPPLPPFALPNLNVYYYHRPPVLPPPDTGRGLQAAFLPPNVMLPPSRGSSLPPLPDVPVTAAGWPHYHGGLVGVPSRLTHMSPPTYPGAHAGGAYGWRPMESMEWSSLMPLSSAYLFERPAPRMGAMTPTGPALLPALATTLPSRQPALDSAKAETEAASRPKRRPRAPLVRGADPNGGPATGSGKVTPAAQADSGKVTPAAQADSGDAGGSTAAAGKPLCFNCGKRPVYCKRYCRSCYEKLPETKAKTRERHQRYNRSVQGRNRVRRFRARKSAAALMLSLGADGGSDGSPEEGPTTARARSKPARDSKPSSVALASSSSSETKPLSGKEA